MFDYLYKLFYALSYKKNFFKSAEDYDNYSMYGATQTFLRLINPKQFLPEDDPKKLKKIKSVLNYIKKILYPAKVVYQETSFNQVTDLEGEAAEATCEYCRGNLSSSQDPLLVVDVEQCLRHIPRTLKAFLLQSPYSDDKIMMKNIYMSCLLTLLRSITISNHNFSRLYTQTTHKLRVNIDKLLDDIYAEEAINAPIVWHLDPSYTTYISVLCNKLKKIIARDIKEEFQSHQLSEDIIQDLLINPYCSKSGGD